MSKAGFRLWPTSITMVELKFYKVNITYITNS